MTDPLRRQGAVWTAASLVSYRASAPRRRLMFGIGAPLSLVASLVALAAISRTTTPAIEEFTTDHWITVQRAPRDYPAA